jgi:hypothetical protein
VLPGDYIRLTQDDPRFAPRVMPRSSRSEGETQIP